MWYTIYKTHYGSLFEQVFVRQFSEVVVNNTQESNTEAVVGVQFSSTAPAAAIPQADDVAKTLLDAVSNSSNTFNITVVPSSIKAAPESTITTPAPNSTLTSTAAEPTTTASTTATTPTATPVVFDVTAVLVEQFVPQLTDRNSTQFKTLEVQVVTMWYTIYKTHYGALFEQVFVRQFSEVVVNNTQESNTEAVVGVQFSSTAPAAAIPQADDVAKTLLDAVSNSSNTFNITVVPSSIKAAPETTSAPTLAGSTTRSAPTTVTPTILESTTRTYSNTTVTQTTAESTITAAPTTLTTTTAAPTTAALTITAASTTVITASAALSSSEATSSATSAVTTPSTTVSTFALSTTAVLTAITTTPITTSQTATTLSPTTSTSPITRTAMPITATTDVAMTTVITKTPVPTTSASSTVLHPTNISTTTTTTTTTTTAPAAPVIVAVTAVLVEAFVPQLADRNSIQFKTLEVQVIQMWYVIYKTQYGDLLEQVFVIEFREAVVKTRASNIEAVVGIQFNNTSPAADIPQADNVAKTLVDAVSNPNNTFNITVETNSITAAPLNTTSTAATTSVTTVTTDKTTTTLTNTASALTTTTAAEGITTVNMVFKTKETFTSDLLDLSSPAFISRTSLIDTIITPIYQSAFSSFRSLQVTGYSNGSIKNSLKLGFASTSVPNNTQIGQVLIKKAPNITAFIIDTNSVFVNDTQVSSGVSHKISLITASCLVLLSWLLTNQQ